MKFTDCADLKHGFQFREEHFSENGVKVTKIGSLINGGGLDFKDVTFIPFDKLKQFSNFTLNKGDVLMALTGATLGKVSKVDTDEIILQNYRVGNFLNKSNSTKEYIYCLLQSPYIQDTIKKLVNEAAQPNLGKGDFDKFTIPLPPTKAEQTAIATALSDTDNYITHLEKLIAKKRLIKQGAMQELLKPKEGWKAKTLGELCELTSSKRIFESEYVPIGIPFYRGKEISLLIDNNKIEVEYFIPERRYEEIKRQFGTPEKNDILITAVGTLANVYLVSDNKKFYFKDGNLIWLRKIQNVNPIF
ncbi:MAG: restriction endonuclease subunit S [Saprospiraceae bacterium]|nr:restriction endonuclease subunit S [Saprospiraceae bacterium]